MSYIKYPTLNYMQYTADNNTLCPNNYILTVKQLYHLTFILMTISNCCKTIQTITDKSAEALYN